MASRTTWGAGFGDDSLLQDISKPFGERSKPFPKASQMTIQLEHVYVNEDRDSGWFRGLSEIGIVSETTFRDQTTVKRFHVFENGIEIPHSFRAIRAQNIYATDDYDGTSSVHIRVQVYELDNISESTVKAIGGIARTAVGLFPATAPFSKQVGNIATALVSAADQLDKNDRIIDDRLMLHPSTEFNEDILQPGRYVIFRDSIDASQLRLASGNEVLEVDGTPFERCSYSVLSAKPVNDVLGDLQLESKVAKLLSQLNDDVGLPGVTYKFLSDTVESATNFNKVRRYRELSRIPNRSDDEQRRFVQLGEDPAVREAIEA